MTFTTRAPPPEPRTDGRRAVDRFSNRSSERPLDGRIAFVGTKVAALLGQSPVLRTAAVWIFAALSVALRARLGGIRLNGPLAGPGDGSIWESMGFYLSRNLKFTPFPHLSLSNNQSFFPYGVDSVFQPWSFERDCFFAIAFTSLGPGPWIQIYCILSLFIGFIGTYWILSVDFGPIRASMAALLVTFFNFYAVTQYPNHVNISTIHWTTLGLLADFVLVRRVVLRHRIPLRLLLLRAALVSLSMGQDLGYVAGFGMTSLVLATGCVVVLGASRAVTGPARRRCEIEAIRTAFMCEIRKHKIAVAALCSLLVAASVLYVPLALQVASETRRFKVEAVADGQSHASPLHLLIPYLPSLNPVALRSWLPGLHTSWRSGTVGWTLLVVGVAGLWCARRNWQMYAPALLMLGLYMAYDTKAFPTLKIFPWFAFSRIAERSTVIYPIIFTTFALSMRFEGIGRISRLGMMTGVALLAIVEGCTAYSLDHRVLYRYEEPFFAYMRAVRNEPGEAVLDWPFCVTGGNGVGSGDGLCPYYTMNHDDLSYMTYHQKKIVGQYYGRLYPSQVTPFLQAHWDRLFSPDDDDIFEARRQTRCFDEQEWAFFTDFFALNDFAGIQLHKALLPASCVEEFYRRFGLPRVEVELPDGDDLAFVAKPALLRERLDPAAGKALVFRRDFEAADGPLDVVRERLPAALDVDGLSRFEHSGVDRWRWGLRSGPVLQFTLRESRPLVLRFTFSYSGGDQHVSAFVNGETAGQFGAYGHGPVESADIFFNGKRGRNSIELRCDSWNGKDDKWFAPGDPRPMNVRWSRLLIE